MGQATAAKFRRELGIFLLILVLFCFCGCSDNDSSSTPSASTVSGFVVGLPIGGTVELLDAEGNRVSTIPVGLDQNGHFLLAVPGPIPESPYFILKLDSSGKTARAVVTGFDGQSEYSAQETVISPDTEAAFLLCSLSGRFRHGDYAAFLGACRDGVFDGELPRSSEFPFREVLHLVSAGVTEYFEGQTSVKPTENQMFGWLQTVNAVLGAFQPGIISEVPMIKRVLVSTDHTGLVYLSWEQKDSILDASQAVTVTNDYHEDGPFFWKRYSVNLGSNQLEGMEMKTVEIVGDLSPDGLTTAADAFVTSSSMLDSGTASASSATGTVKVAASNAANLVDADASGLSPDETNTNGPFVFAFKEGVSTQNTNIVFTLQAMQNNKLKTTGTLATIPLDGGAKYSSPSIDFSDEKYRNHLVVASLINGNDTLLPLFALQDTVDICRYVDTVPMVARRKISETRANTTDMYNNFLNSHDNTFEFQGQAYGMTPITAGNAYSHYIVDVDRLMGKGVVPAWDETTYGNNPLGDNNRTPLVLVHGWQGNRYRRGAALLSFWLESPVNYWYDFICYYLANPELQQKYHLYAMRWPSYKHLAFSGKQFSGMLKGINDDHPETDLALGMRDESVGVVFMTHSTGGLITRTAIEMFDAMSDGSSDHAYLRKAILLASPNHGTPLATNVAPNDWEADTATQGTADLEWDSFDGKSQLKFFFGQGAYFTYLDDRSQNRWPAELENSKAIDQYYLKQLGNSASTVKTFNPWLLWFYKSFLKRSDNLAQKYILYSGWVDDGIFDFIDNGAFSVSAGDLRDMGYQSDGCLTIASNLLASTTTNPVVYPPQSAEAIDSDWYQYSTLYYWLNPYSSDTTPVLVIGDPQDHPLGMTFRMLWDYDHMQTVDGALEHYITSAGDSSVAKFIDSGNVVPDGTPTDFNQESYRRQYIRGALTFNQGSDPGEITQTMNPLTYDPVYLMIEKDLLEIAK